MVTDEFAATSTGYNNPSVIHVVFTATMAATSPTTSSHTQLIARHVALLITIGALGIVAKEDRRIVEGSITDDNATSIVNAQFEKPLPLNGIQGNPAFQSLIVLEIDIGLAADTNAAEDTWRHGIHGRRQGGIEMLGVVEDTIGPMVAVFEFRLATGGEKERKEEEGKR